MHIWPHLTSLTNRLADYCVCQTFFFFFLRNLMTALDVSQTFVEKQAVTSTQKNQEGPKGNFTDMEIFFLWLFTVIPGKDKKTNMIHLLMSLAISKEVVYEQ